MSDELLKKIETLSNGKFGKPIVVSGDAQIVLEKLMEIHRLVYNYRRSGNDEFKKAYDKGYNTGYITARRGDPKRKFIEAKARFIGAPERTGE